MAIEQPNPPASAEPDPRMSLAAERTYLAYARTSLALIAAGVAVVGVWPSGEQLLLRRIMGVLLVLLGSVIAASARRRWRQVDTAMRNGDPLPESFLGPLIAVAMIAIAAVAVVLVLLV